MVIETVPTLSCTGSAAGAIPSLPFPVPSVKLPNVTKAFSSKSITACGLKVANGSVVLTTAIATETGACPAAKGEVLSWVKAPVVHRSCMPRRCWKSHSPHRRKTENWQGDKHQPPPPAKRKSRPNKESRYASCFTSQLRTRASRLRQARDILEASDSVPEGLTGPSSGNISRGSIRGTVETRRM
jgi:hypothetical protein